MSRDDRFAIGLMTFIVLAIVALIVPLALHHPHTAPHIVILPNATHPTTSINLDKPRKPLLGVECVDRDGYRYRAAKCRTP